MKKGRPILTGRSATDLYGAPETELDYNDIGGEATGHFVILAGYDAKKRSVGVVDPMADDPLTQDYYYEVGMTRLMGSILLGVLSWDAVLLVLKPRVDA